MITTSAESQVDIFSRFWIAGLIELRRAALHLAGGWALIVSVLIVHRLVGLLTGGDIAVLSALSMFNFPLLVLGTMVLVEGLGRHMNGIRMVSLFPPYRSMVKFVKACVVVGCLLAIISTIHMMNTLAIAMAPVVFPLITFLAGCVGLAFFWSRAARYEANRKYKVASMLIAAGILLGALFLIAALRELRGSYGLGWLNVARELERFGAMFFVGVIAAGVPSIIAWTLIYTVIGNALRSLEH